MSRFPSRIRHVTVAALSASVGLTGCMYQQPMYQPAPYGQQMYGAPGSYAAPGTMVIPPSNVTPYTPGATGTYDSNIKSDDFKADDNGSTSGGGRFFGEDGGVPTPKDSGATTPGSGDTFNREFP